jgi:hypothetical protein
LQIPERPESLAAHYDLAISHPNIQMDRFAAFDHFLAHAAAEYDLSCALIHDALVNETIQRLGQGQLSIGYHLDYFAQWHVAIDPYARLAFAVADAGGRTVNPPARARAFTDKASAHAEFVRHGLGVPGTVLLRPWVPDRPLTTQEQIVLRLHEPNACLYIKPANGSATRGVVRVENPDPASLQAALPAARALDWQDTYLIQREVQSPLLACEDGCARPAYWRILHCLGDWMVFWWQPQQLSAGRPSYR